jgi:hypothetical protein
MNVDDRTVIRPVAAVVLLLSIVAACGGEPNRDSDGGRRADVEFTIVAATSERREAVAIALWKTGYVERVAPPADGSGPYRVYLKDPGNLVVMAHVHETLEAQDGVAGVWSLARQLAGA